MVGAKDRGSDPPYHLLDLCGAELRDDPVPGIKLEQTHFQLEWINLPIAILICRETSP